MGILKESQKQLEYANLLDGLSLWLKIGDGRGLYTWERHVLAPRLRTLRGEFGAYLGLSTTTDWLRSPLRCMIQLGASAHHRDPENLIVSQFDHWPLRSESLDCIIVQHMLDFYSRPYALLREIRRTLKPRGTFFILGFNPYSLWGGLRLVDKGIDPCLHHGHFLSATKVQDWLRRLQLHPDRVQYGPVLWPNFGVKPGRLSPIPFGNFYLITGVRNLGAGITPPEKRKPNKSPPRVITSALPSRFCRRDFFELC